jgi:formate hydrogenlyase subunit 4
VQPYRDLAKLWRKEALLPDGVSPVTVAAPGVVLGVALTLAAALPLAPHGGSDAVADIIALGFLLALGRFALTLAGLDSRSAFTGMAASRELTFGALVEPAFVIALLGAAAYGGGTRLSGLLVQPFGLATALAFAAFMLVLVAETARVPIDNQETHYELTMIHEGLLLEYGGWQLAALQLAAQVKQLALLLLGAVMLPGHGTLATALWVVVIAVAITIAETVLAKLRLFEVPQLLATAAILAVTSIGLRAIGGVG